jgi:NAD+ diphosphatase
MSFVSAVEPPAENNEPAWWFAFKGNELLVEVEGDSARVPFVVGLGAMHLRVQRKQYLGRLDGKSCYSAELDDGTAAPEGMSFLALRRLFHLLDPDLMGIAGRAVQIVDWDRSHQFCGRCGAPAENKREERAKICRRCGLLSFPRISPAVIVAVVRDEKLLLARARHFPSGMHSVLAGFVEPGETLDECVMREVKEEVGVDVANIRYFGSQPWPFPNSLMIAFTAEHAGGEIIVDETELASAGWFTAAELPRIPEKVTIARHLIDWFVAGGER